MSLRFGTAGLRAPIGPGPDHMNVTQVTRTSAAVAAWLSRSVAASHNENPELEQCDNHFVSLNYIGANHIRHNGTMRIVVGYDARYGSHTFAVCAAEVFAGAGCEVTLLPNSTPTPLIPWMVKKDEYDAGIQITASHNPAAQNGYKIYLKPGFQIDTQSSQEIETMMALLDDIHSIPRVHVRPTTESIRRYVDDLISLVEPDENDRLRVNNERAALKIVYTAMHGVGAKTLNSVLQNSGFALSWPVLSQQHPDPTFPTIPFPNPEEHGVTDQLLILAREKDADILIALDPDADRCAIGIKMSNNQHRMLRGDELGPLLATRLITEPNSVVASTFASSRLLKTIAEDKKWVYKESSSGFKNLMRLDPNLSFAYEEALGTAPAPWLVGDKDGIATALITCAWAAELKAKGLSLEEELRALYRTYGAHCGTQISIRTSDPHSLVVSLSSKESFVLGGIHCTQSHDDYDEDFSGAVYHGSDPDSDTKIRIVVRASNTENKTKIYVEVISQESQETATKILDAIAKDIKDLTNTL